jgi:hypothetical protein
MNTIAVVRPQRPADLIRRMVLVGLLSALAFVAYLGLTQFDVARECRGGAFSSGFGPGFDVRRCDITVRRFGREIGRVPLNVMPHPPL